MRGKASMLVAPVSKLQHKPGMSYMLGCDRCIDRAICGGIQVEAPAFSCLDHCNCDNHEVCDLVCPRNPKAFAKRVREVNGFGFDDIPKRDSLPTPDLPNSIHLIYRSLPLKSPITLDVVAIPFSAIYRRAGKGAEPRSRQELEERFCLGPNTKIVLSGVEQDNRVELSWGAVGLRDVFRDLPRLGVVMATTPNFSLMADVPRQDNLHAMKRIALIWGQLHDAKVPTALHLNGRTDHDFKRYREFLQYHDEIESISFEFTTGTANTGRGQYFVEMLGQLAKGLDRPLTLVLRGDPRWAIALAQDYSRIVTINSTACLRTIKRKRATLSQNKRLSWDHHPTIEGEPLDELLSHNLTQVGQWMKNRVGKIPKAKSLQPQVVSICQPHSKDDSDTRDESTQLCLL